MSSVLELELEGLEELMQNGHLRDPGLYPGYTYFHANSRSGWLRFVSGQYNILQSAYRWANKQGESNHALNDARIVFLDSGAISPLIAAMLGKGPGSDVLRWMDRQEDILKCAAELHAAGVDRAVVAALDLPQYDHMLQPAGLTRVQAMELTLRNAEQFAAAWYEGKLPPNYIPFFSVQGTEAREYVACMDAYEKLGILGMIREGEAWLGVGGTRDANSHTLLTVYRTVRERLGVGHIHALGVGRRSDVVELARRGYINGSDSSAVTQEVMFNRGTYRFYADKLPRPFFLTEALWAAAAAHYEAQLAAALKRGYAEPVAEQGTLL